MNLLLLLHFMVSHPSVHAVRTGPHLVNRQVPLQRSFKVSHLSPKQMHILAALLDRHVKYLGYDASSVQPHFKSLSIIPLMADDVRKQMVSFPDRRQFIHLATYGGALKVYAMPLFVEKFNKYRPILGSVAGTGDSFGVQRVMLLGVRKPQPLDLTLYRGPQGGEQAKVELYGIAGFSRAATFHSRIENMWFGKPVAESLKEILRY